MKIWPATAERIAEICLRMRAASAAEAFASLAHEDRGALARSIQACRPHAITMVDLRTDAGRSAALVGLFATAPGRAGILFLATDDFPAIAGAVQRWWHRQFVPSRLSHFRRVEFTGSPPDTPSGRWLVSLGFACEGIARAYGKRGEDFGHWAWINGASATRMIDAVAPPLGSVTVLPPPEPPAHV